MKRLPPIESNEWGWYLGSESGLWCAKGVTKYGWHVYVSREHMVDVSHYVKHEHDEYPDTDAFLILRGPEGAENAKRFAERTARRLRDMLKRGRE